MTDNLLLMTDSYKASHFKQYPPGSEIVNSYIESRGGKYEKTVFFGLQYFIKKHLTGQVVTQEKIDEAAEIFAAHGEPFNREGWEYILNEHGGRLPIEIEAVPEGTVMPLSNVLVQARNTDPKAFWLTSYLETALLRAVWYPTTIASKSYHCKRVIQKYLVETSDPDDFLTDFRLHDFGARGVSSGESAMIGGAAHLVNFMGTDTVESLVFLRDYYGAVDIAGFSVPATEHSTMTTWGGPDHEVASFRHMMEQYKDYAILSVVSDSYDYWHALDEWIDLWIHDDIPEGMKLVIRPDSGDPVATVLGSLHKLWAGLGKTAHPQGRRNSKGYKVLPTNIGLLQGDGINEDTIAEILQEMKIQGFAASNIVFGMGGGLLQNSTRDTLKFAMKCSAIRVNGEWRDVYKEPVGDASKASKRGILKLMADMDTLHGPFHYFTTKSTISGPNQLKTVFRNGELLIDQTLAEIRERTNVDIESNEKAAI